MSEGEVEDRIERASSYLDEESSLDKINFSNSKFDHKRSYPLRVSNFLDDEPLPLILDKNDLMSPYSNTSGTKRYSSSNSEPLILEECAID